MAASYRYLESVNTNKARPKMRGGGTDTEQEKNQWDFETFFADEITKPQQIKTGLRK